MNYVMADIHGDDIKFFEMLYRVNFSQDDRLYILGDAVDHGKNSLKILDFIMHQDNIILLKGNHELFLQLYLEEDLLLKEKYVFWGGKNTISELELCDESQKAEYLKFLRDLPIYMEIDVNDRTFFMTHSGFILDSAYEINKDGSLNLGASIEKWCKESEFRYLISQDIHHIPSEMKFKNAVIVGHVPVQKLYGNKIYFGEYIIDIDCGVSTFSEGILGCLRLEDMEEYYIG